jgi:hypothetical protein
VGTLGLITVPSGSELIIGEAEAGIELHTSGIVIAGGLFSGSATCRISSPVTITLHGERPATKAERDAMPPEAKGISVQGGTLELHGKSYYRTWARLAHTVSPGDDVVLLQAAVNWQAGQEIVLVTTALKDARDWHRNEVVVIAEAVSDRSQLPEGVGTAVRLTSPAMYKHTATDAYQGEVGLLSRMIKVEGSADDSEPTDTSPAVCSDSQSTLSSQTVPCADSYLTGYGGHILVTGPGAVARVQGVELFRMGQTNVLGRYPMHYHMMADEGANSYMRDCSVHRSFYRCLSIHGTHQVHVSQNVAYDVSGYCFYLEDGVEEENRIEFNLVAHVHFLGTPARSSSQFIADVAESDDLINPADVTASGFYITNGHNYVIGNAASGGWAGFAFPELPSPIMRHRHLKGSYTPSAKPLLAFEGNSAHSSGFWWDRGGVIYFGGKLYHPEDGSDRLMYNPGRQNPARSTCAIEPCESNHWSGGCSCEGTGYEAYTTLQNTKVFLSAGVGISHWGARVEVVGFEAHDVALSISILGAGYIHDGLIRCRTGDELQLPCDNCDAGRTLAQGMLGTGFEWYDTDQAHIVSSVTFRKCGVQTSAISGGGCGDGLSSGCLQRSSVWSMLTHSDRHVPEFMQATKDITYEDCGLHFRMRDYVRDNGRTQGNGMASTVSERIQSWLDVDGTASGLNGPAIIGSGVEEAGEWWQLEDGCTRAVGAPLWLCPSRGTRQVGSINMEWDGQPSGLGSNFCSNGDPTGVPCTPVAFLKHWGGRYGSGGLGFGLPVTLNAESAGPLGGFGWHLRFIQSVPKVIRITRIQVAHTSKLILSIAYPTDASVVSIIAAVPSWCSRSATRSCSEVFTRVGSIAAVRSSLGNTYHLADGLLTVRIVQPPDDRTGSPDWAIPVDPAGAFVREGISIPRFGWNPFLTITVACAGGGDFCDGAATTSEPVACPEGFQQTAYDECCPAGAGTAGSTCVGPDDA